MTYTYLSSVGRGQKARAVFLRLPVIDYISCEHLGSDDYTCGSPDEGGLPWPGAALSLIGRLRSPMSCYIL